MGRENKTREVILQLKAVKEEQGYTYQKIVDMVLANGGTTSLTTVRRVFAEDSENQSFRYESTIQPIAAVMLRIDEPPQHVEGEVETEAEALRALVRLKNTIIDEHEATISNIRAREQEIKDDAQRKIDHLRGQIQELQKILDERKEFMTERRDFIHRLEAREASQRRTITILAIIVAVLALVIFTALVVDRANSGIGFFWLEETLSHVFNGVSAAGSGGLEFSELFAYEM